MDPQRRKASSRPDSGDGDGSTATKSYASEDAGKHQHRRTTRSRSHGDDTETKRNAPVSGDSLQQHKELRSCPDGNNTET